MSVYSSLCPDPLFGDRVSAFLTDELMAQYVDEAPALGFVIHFLGSGTGLFHSHRELISIIVISFCMVLFGLFYLFYWGLSYRNGRRVLITEGVNE